MGTQRDMKCLRDLMEYQWHTMGYITDIFLLFVCLEMGDQQPQRLALWFHWEKSKKNRGYGMISWLLGYSWFRESIVIHEPLNCKGCTVWLFLGVELGIQWEVVGIYMNLNHFREFERELCNGNFLGVYWNGFQNSMLTIRLSSGLPVIVIG